MTEPLRPMPEPAFERFVWPYRLTTPALTLMALYVRMKKRVWQHFGKRLRTNFWLFDGISVNARRVKEGAACWRALDTVYNFRKGEGGTLVSRIADGFWLHIRNAQAARNRLIIAKRELARAVTALQPLGRPVRILSLAAGTTQGVLEVIAETNIPAEILLIDQDPSALAHANELARAHGIGASLVTRLGSVAFFDRLLGRFEPDIVEMMGLTDYLRDALAVALFKKIFRTLKSGGVFFTCHVHPNKEAFFLSQVVNWRMLYRSKKQLEDILMRGGFRAPRLLTEPLHIHSVAVAVK